MDSPYFLAILAETFCFWEDEHLLPREVDPFKCQLLPAPAISVLQALENDRRQDQTPNLAVALLARHSTALCYSARF